MFLLVLFACTAVAFAVSAVSGGGAGLALMPVLRLGLPMAQVPVALSLGSAASSLARIGVFASTIQWRMVLRFVPASLPGALLGAWLLQYADPVYAELAIGLFLVANLPMLWRKPRDIIDRCAPSAGWLMPIGFLAGFVSGFTGAVGLLFNGFYLRYRWSREQLIATRAANELVLHVVKLILYLGFGLVTADALRAGAVLGAAAVIAALGVRRILPLVGERAFRYVGYGTMVLAGVAMLDGAASRIAATHALALHTHRADGGFDARLQGFGRDVTVEFRRMPPMEVAYEVALADLPHHLRDRVVDLADGADRVVVQAVHSLTRRDFEVHVWRGGITEIHAL